MRPVQETTYKSKRFGLTSLARMRRASVREEEKTGAYGGDLSGLGRVLRQSLLHKNKGILIATT